MKMFFSIPVSFVCEARGIVFGDGELRGEIEYTGRNLNLEL